MSRNDYIRPANMIAAVTIPVAADFEKIDQRCVEGLDGTGGGSYTLKHPLALGGAGGQIGQNGSRIQGGVETRQCEGSAAGLILADDDFPTYSPSRARTTKLVFSHNAYKGGGFDLSLGGMVSRLVANASPLLILVPPRFLHNGATLASVTMKFRIGKRHVQIPTGGVLPSLTVYKISSSGAATTMGGQSMAAPATPEDYYMSGAIQSVTAAVTVAPTVDTTAASYALGIQDETGSGALAGNIFISASFAHTGIADMRWT